MDQQPPKEEANPPEGGRGRGVRFLRRTVRVILDPEHLRRTGMITLVVGTWLTLFNQYDVLWAGEWSGRLLFKVFLNYLTPFVVSNAGLISFQEE